MVLNAIFSSGVFPVIIIKGATEGAENACINVKLVISVNTNVMNRIS